MAGSEAFVKGCVLQIGLPIGVLAVTLGTGSWTPRPELGLWSPCGLFQWLLGILVAVEHSDPRTCRVA
eukprot:15450316-Alexandrium_andersonii.AAC.1